MIYNGAYYYFEKNLFGDVIKAYDSNGAEVASFIYSAYGEILHKSGSMADKVHFRYRGYYYDDETGFYYLQSRYYDPSICRFISADQYELLPTLSTSLGELNLYSYCANNPIMYTDENGQGIGLIIAILIGFTVAGGIAGGVISYNNGARGWDVVKDTVLGASIGLAIGGAIILIGGATTVTLHALNIGGGTFLGVQGAKAFAYGALAFDFTAFIIAPIYGFSMQGIEYETPTPTYQPPKRQIIPPHPYTKYRKHNKR